MTIKELEKSETLFLLYTVYKQEIQLKYKNENRVTGAMQDHEYAFNKLKQACKEEGMK